VGLHGRIERILAGFPCVKRWSGQLLDVREGAFIVFTARENRLQGGMQNTDVFEPGFDLEATRPAGFWIRLGAYLIDFIIILIPIVGSLFMKSAGSYLLIVLATVLYKPLMEGLLGGTAGKLAVGLRVINSSGEKIGIVGGIIRSGLFILPVIPSALMQVRMIEAGISPFDPEATAAFREANQVLNIAYWVLTLLALVSCIVVAFTQRKRGLHDMIADTYVIHEKATVEADEG
jgi:uncharacterized RDD family membrane protein YckC